MPRLWQTTIDAHRREVRGAILDAAQTLAGRDGLGAVTMIAVAAEAGVGRATLYKYFGDVQSVLRAWHERAVESHLARLRDAASLGSSPRERLESLLGVYATIVHAEHGTALVALLRDGESSTKGFTELERLLSSMLRVGVKAGDVRADVSVSELAHYCRHALSGAHLLPSAAAVRRLVGVTTGALWRLHAARGTTSRRPE